MNRSKLSNVVHLDEHKKSPGLTDRTRSGSVLKHCRELASSTLIDALPIVMDKLDDALFDLANRSGNSKEQGVYFETMRQVRVKRASIETEFRRFFKESVRSTIERVAGSTHSNSLAGTSSADLGLVDEGDFEETLAVTNMVRKIRRDSKQLLYALERRIAELLAVDELKPEDNPFGPEAMCGAFKDACGQIDAGVEVRLIILKLFDRHVGAEVQQLYGAINDYLVSQGVLPEIRHHVKIQPSAARPTGHHASGRESYAHPGPGAQAPGGHHQAHGGAAYSPSVEQWGVPPATHHQPIHEDGATMTAPMFAAPTSAVLLDALRQIMDVNFTNRTGTHTPGEEQLQVVSQLTHLQHGNTAAVCEELASLDVSGVHAGTVNVLRDLKQANVVNGMAEMDAMMFDVVAMMFDFILDDKKIPAPMKALIGRLQIPMLKVAILDKEFFARKFHPARKFLNSIADAAVGWSEDQDRNDALYTKLESIVGRILDEFDARIDVFTEVLAELESFLDQEENQAENTASTFADVIQDRERLTLARKNAEELTTRCLEKARIHSVVREFLIGHWKELLFIRHFEEGEGGDGWNSAVQTMDDLVWSIAPKTLTEDRSHLTEVLPGLLRRIRDGMKQLGIPARLAGNFLGALKKLHIAAIRNEVCVGDPDEVKELSRGATAENGASLDSADLDLQGIDFQWSDEATYSVEELSLIQLAIERANDVIYGTAEARPECAGMGTTLVAVQFHDSRLTAAHVGDARLYRLRSDVFQRMTTDHSLRQQLVNKGFYTAEEVEEKIQSNVITRAVGPESAVEVDVQEIATERDDLYLLCSDGLTDMVDDVTLAEILCENKCDLATASRMLVDTANKNGGRDNISVVLARVVSTYPDSMPGDEEFDPKAKLDMYGLTDVGIKRSHNEDHIAIDAELGIAIVADGMGGCNAGEVASEIAVKIVLEALRNGSVESINVTSGDGIRTSRVTADEQLTEASSRASALLNHHDQEIVIQGLGADVAYDPEEEDEYTEIVRNLDVGSWVEFYHVDGAKTPARLTWMSPVTGRYLFTDRKGMKVVDATIHGLAVEMKRGSVAIIEDVPLFDRIIGTITEHLHADGARAH